MCGHKIEYGIHIVDLSFCWDWTWVIHIGSCMNSDFFGGFLCPSPGDRTIINRWQCPTLEVESFGLCWDTNTCSNTTNIYCDPWVDQHFGMVFHSYNETSALTFPLIGGCWNIILTRWKVLDVQVLQLCWLNTVNSWDAKIRAHTHTYSNSFDEMESCGM